MHAMKRERKGEGERERGREGEREREREGYELIARRRHRCACHKGNARLGQLASQVEALVSRLALTTSILLQVVLLLLRIPIPFRVLQQSMRARQAGLE
jgi:hypothetical protein